MCLMSSGAKRASWRQCCQLLDLPAEGDLLRKGGGSSTLWEPRQRRYRVCSRGGWSHRALGQGRGGRQRTGQGQVKNLEFGLCPNRCGEPFVLFLAVEPLPCCCLCPARSLYLSSVQFSHPAAGCISSAQGSRSALGTPWSET